MTAEIGRIFCPKCGNGGTLCKVAVTVGENEIVLASHRPRITLHGTKVSSFTLATGKDSSHFFSAVLLIFYIFGAVWHSLIALFFFALAI